MSSAALHAVPPPATQPYHVAALSSPPNVSPVSSRKARSPSGSASTPQTNHYAQHQHHHQQQQQQQYSPQQSQHTHHSQQLQTSSPAMTGTPSRGHSSHVSPSSRNVSSAPYETYYDDQPDHDAQTSPYTSAYHQGQQDRSSTSRAPPQQYVSGYGSGSEREIPEDSPTQSRPREYLPPSAEQSPHPTTRPNLPQAESTIINRVVITDPQEDVERAQVRAHESQAGLPDMAALNVDDGARAGPRSRQEHLKTNQPRKETKFGEYILGQTLGEGEFGKVKMGWKKDGGVQVAIKLIRKESLGNNPNRLPKIYREISILRELRHPNIVRLHEMVETERHIGIILEYASGGELFDYILNHRYLNDKAARRLFAQLVSGVGYLHKKGIVHRDLKLENLLLDRNKNIIITDFGFANTFNAVDELGEEVELGLADKDFVKRRGLDQILKDGHRRGDLMQTSCGSPCYAAPELVVSDSLYTGRKVDVWSCGVILYAMLAGYLPFDDDPANPEGDNINLLYKYIVTTPLTFPEYVTPHARDLLRRILVPDPRKRADLFEVARHSWLSEYAKVVEHVTSGATTVEEIANTTVPMEDPYTVPPLGRSASVREPSRSQQPAAPGGIKHATPISPGKESSRQQRDEKHKRATLQVEYVEPNTSTTRGEPVTALPPPQTTGAMSSGAPTTTSSQSKTRARGDSTGGPTEVASSAFQSPATSSRQQRPTTQSNMPPPARPGRDPARSVSESTALNMNPPSSGRPSTSGTMDRATGSRLPSRGNSYGQAIAPTVAATNAEGRFSQPKNSGYIISSSVPEGQSSRNSYAGRPLSQQLPADFNARAAESRPERPTKGHKRSNTVESFTNKIFGRSGSRRQSHGREEGVRPERPEKPSRMYPPLSMRNAMPNDPESVSRPSTESRRQSFTFNRDRKNSDAGQAQPSRSSRRFSFLPASFSRMSFSSTPKEQGYDSGVGSRRGSTAAAAAPGGMAFGQGRSRSPSQSTTGSNIPVLYDSSLDNRQRRMQQQAPVRGATAPNLSQVQQDNNMAQQQYPRHQAQPQPQQYGQHQAYNYGTPPSSASRQRPDNFYTPTQSVESQALTDNTAEQRPPRYPAGFNDNDKAEQARPVPRQQAVLQKNRRFGDSYEGGSNGSSSGAKRVMDWFRKRGKDRST